MMQKQKDNTPSILSIGSAIVAGSILAFAVTRIRSVPANQFMVD